MQMKTWKDMQALVTGAASGIGRALALELARRGRGSRSSTSIARWGLLRIGPRLTDNRRRRQHLHRLGLLVGAADPWSRRPAGAERDRPRCGRRHHVRRSDRRRGPARRGDRGADALGRDGADDLVRHRGDDERHPPGPSRDRPREAAQVRRRLPRPCRRPARPGRLRRRHPGDPREPRRYRRRDRDHDHDPVERPRGAARAPSAAHEFAAVLFETVPANMGVVPASRGFWPGSGAARRRTAPCSWPTR